MRRNFATCSPPIAQPAAIGAALPAEQPAVQFEVVSLPVDAPLPAAADVAGKAFDAAVQRGGGHFVTVKPSANTYMPVYYSHGKSYAGHVHHTKHHKSGASLSSSSSSDDD